MFENLQGTIPKILLFEMGYRQAAISDRESNQALTPR